MNKKLERVLEMADKHKFTISSLYSGAEVYLVLNMEKAANIIPQNEFDLVYISHAYISIPILYSIAFGVTYLEVKYGIKIANKINKIIWQRD